LSVSNFLVFLRLVIILAILVVIVAELTVKCVCSIYVIIGIIQVLINSIIVVLRSNDVIVTVEIRIVIIGDSLLNQCIVRNSIIRIECYSRALNCT